MSGPVMIPGEVPHHVFLSVVIPIYNNADCLEELVNRMHSALSTVQIDDFEVIFVDDGSQDNSRELLRRLCSQDHRLKLIGLSRNFGHQFALTAGLDCSKGEAVLVMDGDLQDPPEVIPEFVEKWRKGYDVVYGVRVEREQESWFKRGMASAFYRMLRLMSRTEIQLDSGDFRLMSRRAIDVLCRFRERTRFIRGMVSWLGFAQAPVYYKRGPRWAGTSQYSLSKLMRLALDGVMSFSDLPLRAASWLGFAGVAVCLVYLAYALSRWALWGIPVQGWASLVAIIIFIGSVQLTMIGVMGQYIGRIFEEVKGRPLYIIQEAVGFEGERKQ